MIDLTSAPGREPIEALAHAAARFAPRLRDDLRSEAILAALEVGDADPDPGPFIARSLRSFLERERARGMTGTRGHARFRHDPAILALVASESSQADRLRPASPAAPRTAGQARRRRRDVAIFVLARAGLSQRWIGDLFELPHSRVGAIVAAVAVQLSEREAEPPHD